MSERETQADGRLLRRLATWAGARAERLNVVRLMTALRCEYADKPEVETGYSGTPRCRHSGTPVNDWCEPCRQRDELYRHQLLMLKRLEREHFRLLTAMVDRRSGLARVGR